MGIYDREYCKIKKKEKKLKHLIFGTFWWLIVLLFLVAFVVYLLAVFSKK